MTAPANFILTPANPGEQPPPYPPRYLKRHIYTDPSVFGHIDEHAINEARTNYRVFRDLIWNLIYKVNLNELERARAIFRWLTTKNLYTIFFNSQMPGTPEQLIVGFKDGKTTYAKIFECLATYAGLHCVTISGWAKGVDCKPGSPITSSASNHSWNAVYIDGGWQLVDCHWATRYVQSDQKRRNEHLVYEYDDFYFLPEPSQLIYSHCPEEASWQLLNPIRSKTKDFEMYPLVKSYFFAVGLQFLQQNRGVLFTKRGLVTVTLGYVAPIAFTHKVVYGETGADTLQGFQLKRFVIQETTENRVTFYFRAPREGVYYLTIFAQQLIDGQRLESVFRAACEYKITCDRTSATDASPAYTPPDDVRPFPRCADINWGAGYPVVLYGMVPSHRIAILAAPNGRAEVSFTLSRPVKLHAKLVRDGISESALDKCVTVGEQDNQVFVSVRLSAVGEYGLEIYACEPARDGDTFTHICQYLIAYTDKDFGAVYGQVYDRSDLYNGMQAVGPVYSQPSSRYGTLNNGSVRRPPPNTGTGSVRGQPPLALGAAQDDRVVMRRPKSGQRNDYPENGSDFAKVSRQQPRSRPDSRVSSSRRQNDARPLGDDVTRNGSRLAAVDERPKNPLEVVYVTNVIENPQQPVRKKDETDVNSKPVEIVYVTNKQGLTSKRNSNEYPFDRAPPPTQDRSEKEKRRMLRSTPVDPVPPISFQPIPVRDPIMKPEPPPPEVPPKPFDDDTDVFEDVDQHAVEVSKQEHRSFRDLVWHLIFARDITDELEKARVIYLWLCSKDLTKLSFVAVQQDSPEEILMHLARSLTTYAVVYEILCRYAGLNCVTIPGYAKGAEYKPGMRFVGELGQHSWNAVRVKGIWRLIDCHWSARRLVGKKITPENVRYELDEYYFMPDPHQLIFTHFPDDKNWQLLDRPINLTDFENLVSVKSAFFKYGLQVMDHRQAVIRVKNDVTVRINCSSPKAAPLSLTFTLTLDDGREEYDGTKLSQFGMHELLDGIAYFTLRPPVEGLYRLIIYAKDLDKENTRDGVYGAVCEYAIDCESSTSRPVPFPPCVHTSWGPGDSAAKYGIVAQQKGAIFETVDGIAEIRLGAPGDLRFTAKLKATDGRGGSGGLVESWRGGVVHRIVGDVATFTVTVQEPGEYGLEIYANDPAVDGASMYHVFQYLIICNETTVTSPDRSSIGPFDEMKSTPPRPAIPDLPPGFLGPQPQFRKLGIQCASHEDPFIKTDVGEFQVAFLTSLPVRMTSQLVRMDGDNDTEYNEHVLQQCRGTTSVAFHIRLPKAGIYRLQLYALPASDPSDNLPSVYNCLIDYSGRALNQTSNAPFPRQFGQWKDGCFLYEPLDGHIRPNLTSSTSDRRSAGSWIHFKIDVPRANAVAVVIGDDWSQLETRGNAAGDSLRESGPSGAVWEGQVNLSEYWGRESQVFICANYGHVSSSYHTLLEYTI